MRAPGGGLQEVEAISARWRAERAERQSRRHLDARDFDALREAGLWLSVVPEQMGGSWQGMEVSVRTVCEALRRLAGADPSVALVSSMHPAVVAFWLASPDATQPDWEEQRNAVFASAAAGEQWGTITSEPGSGGDISQTRAVARRADAPCSLPGRTYTVTGDKHFGSGMGVSDWMITTAVPDGESAPAFFVLDVRDRPLDGSAGLQLIAEWDGMGMAATQSHAVRLDGAPAVRFGRDDPLEMVALAATPFIVSLFTSVILGVLDEAIAVSRQRLGSKAETLRAYERVEWSRAEQDHWVAVQAYEGALRAVEAGEPLGAVHAALRGKQAVADLAEDTLRRLCRVHGGGTFSRSSPFAHWFEDVRALGFLRPPWGLAYDRLFATSLELDELRPGSTSEPVMTSENDDNLPAKLGAPARRALAAAGITRLEQLAQRHANDIKRLHGIGPKGLDQLRSALAANGLSFAKFGGTGRGNEARR